jgi:hypothetical protein
MRTTGYVPPEDGGNGAPRKRNAKAASNGASSLIKILTYAEMLAMQEPDWLVEASSRDVQKACFLGYRTALRLSLPLTLGESRPV